MLFTSKLLLLTPLLAAAVPLQDESQTANGQLSARQWPIPIDNSCANRYSRLKGNGDPRQWYKYTQITTNNDCNQNTGCEIAASRVKGKSISWSLSAGFGLGNENVNGFFSGGFEVVEYSEEGEMPNCQGETGETICVFQRIAHTAYVVEEWQGNCAGDDKYLGDHLYQSPNAGGIGNSYVCAKQSCSAKDNEFWGGVTMPGGPMDYPWENDVEVA